MPWPTDDGYGVPDCKCWNSDADHRLFVFVRAVGTDMTDGRYAEVSVHECWNCGLLWLRYSVEYEGFSRSGRWARANISRPAAGEVTPELALSHLERDEYAYGGSYFDGVCGWRRGPMPWG